MCLGPSAMRFRMFRGGRSSRYAIDSFMAIQVSTTISLGPSSKMPCRRRCRHCVSLLETIEQGPCIDGQTKITQDESPPSDTRTRHGRISPRPSTSPSWRRLNKSPIRVAYERRNRDLDPQIVWRGKDTQDWSDLVVQAPPLFIQEKVHPKVLIDDLWCRQSKDCGSGACRR